MAASMGNSPRSNEGPQTRRSSRDFGRRASVTGQADVFGVRGSTEGSRPSMDSLFPSPSRMRRGSTISPCRVHSAHSLHHLSHSPTRLGGPGPSFEELLQRLTSMHESQLQAIRCLTHENLHLKEQLVSDAVEKGSSPCSWLMREQRQMSSQSMVISSTGERTPKLSETDKAPRTPKGNTVLELSKVPNAVNVLPPEPNEDGAYNSEGATGDSRGDGRRTSIDSSNSMISVFAEGWNNPELWPDWYMEVGEPLRLPPRSSLSHVLVVEDTTGQAMNVANRVWQKLILRPNSVRRLLWDFISSILVCYDLISIPLMAISLKRDELMGGGVGQFTDIMDWVTTIFWTMDIPWSFMTGFHAEGVVEMRCWEIAKHYCRTWFVFDLLIIIIDWGIVYLARQGRSVNVAGLFRVGKAARMARILRTVRLLRFVKLQRALAEALELINSESIRAGFNICLAVVFIIGINHYLACGWFLVGHVGRLMEAPNWIEMNKIQEGTVAYAYFSSLHWSLTQFTPASMEIRPYNLLERIYSILCLLFAIITFSSFLGSITASITQLRKTTTEAGRQQFVLRSYFMRNKVSRSLSKSIWSFLMKNHFSHQTRTAKANLEVLKLLPPHLHGKLHQELYGPYITRAPFFYHYMAFSVDALVEVCSKATSERAFVCNELLFVQGKAAEKMFFTASGYLKYDHQSIEYNQSLGCGAWIAEPALWVKWVHLATLSAVTSAEIIEVDSQRFRQSVSQFKASTSFAKVYAQRFYEYLEEIGPEAQTDLITDIEVLESMTRSAWVTVSSAEDVAGYPEIPHKEFPHLDRARQKVRSLLYKNNSRWRRVFGCMGNQRMSGTWSLGNLGSLSSLTSI